MNKKSMGILVLAALAFLSFTGCSREEQTYTEKERVVQTRILTMSALPETISYLGFVEPEEVKTYALKTSGLIDTVTVKSGDKVAVGDMLVTLDSYEYDLGLQASSEQVKLAQLDLSKAVEARDFYKKTYEDTLTLFNSGVVSSIKVDEIKLQYDIKVKEVEQASKVLNQAKLDSDYKSSTLSDTALFSDMNGYVVDVLGSEGELLSQGYPVVIARSETNIVKVGMSQEDVKRIVVGDHADVVAGDQTYKGTVSNINLMPDRLSKTYDVEILIENGDFLIGESCKVYIDLEDIEGIWINITDVKNDGIDYVFAVDNGRATRIDIELHEINGSLVRVTNLEDGVEIITTNTNVLSEGYKVKVEGEANE
ncbi:MAG: efflux RND transporter periplasmic adaptor subunit [Clostridiales bacterium]|nr:efflux RND transporter periplasmic adaptor subunit [Clostridiales bacterium]